VQPAELAGVVTAVGAGVGVVAGGGVVDVVHPAIRIAEKTTNNTRNNVLFFIILSP
jgi:hypothetical protein